MMRMPRSPVKSASTVHHNARSVIHRGRADDDTNRRRRSVIHRGRAAARNCKSTRERCKAQSFRCRHSSARQTLPRMQTASAITITFFPMIGYPSLLFGRLNPRISAKLPKESVPRPLLATVTPSRWRMGVRVVTNAENCAELFGV